MSFLFREKQSEFSFFAICHMLGVPNANLSLNTNKKKNGDRKHCLCQSVWQYSISVLKIHRSKDFLHMVLMLLIFKVYRYFRISKIEILNFCGNENFKEALI